MSGYRLGPMISGREVVSSLVNTLENLSFRMFALEPASE